MFQEFVAWVDALTPQEFEQLRNGHKLVWSELDYPPGYIDMMLIKDALDVRQAREDGHAEALAECVLSFSSNARRAAECPDCAEDYLFSVARDMIARAVSVTRWQDLAVFPPDAESIRDIRAAVGTQSLCAALAGVDIRSWQRYEAGDKRPPPPTWGLFLLAIGQHPRGRYVPH